MIGFTGDVEGEPVGAGVAGAGVVVDTGAGVEAGLFGTSGFVSQAPKTAAETARTVVKMIDLLIVFLLFCSLSRCPNFVRASATSYCHSRTRGRPLADFAAGLIHERLSALDVPFTINTALGRTRRNEKLAKNFLAAEFVVDVNFFAARTEVVTSAATAFNISFRTRCYAR